MEEKESEVNAAFPILRSWGYKTLLEGQISKHLVKPQRVLCALVFLIEFLYQSKCFREVSFSGNKPACGIDKHQASQNRDAQQKQEADEWSFHQTPVMSHQVRGKPFLQQNEAISNLISSLWERKYFAPL